MASTAKDTWNVLIRFCSYQERCKSDIIKKMQRLLLPEDEFSKWIAKLEEENFLNEVRFTKGFVQGRFKYKGWGISKIKRELKLRGIDSDLIDQVIDEEIETEDYVSKALSLAAKKWKTVKGKSDFERKVKIQKFLITKGFEFSVIKEVMQDSLFQ